MQPNEEVAQQIVRSVFGQTARRLSRFPTGLEHWVYDVALESGRPLVVRIASPENRAALEGALYWSPKLRRLGLPLPEVYHFDFDGEFPFVVLERLAGTDLGHVYATLSVAQRRCLASELSLLQQRAGELPEASGFGYALHYEGRLARSWRGVLRSSLRRGQSWIEAGALADPTWADRVAERLAHSDDDFADVLPKPFLHDITTKNVIVSDGRLTGIVDVDSMAFGDPLWTIALTRMSLLAMQQPTDYIDAWCSASPFPVSSDRLDLYTALHGINFLGELGQALNRPGAAPVDPSAVANLERILAVLLR